jgi:Family of unknown function (DUF5677)
VRLDSNASLLLTVVDLRMPDVATWTTFAANLRKIGLDIFACANVQVTEARAADLRVLALMLLARTLSNLKAALILLREDQIVEARAISRCLYENQYWVLALLKDGDKFRSDMVNHEMRHKRTRMQTLFQNKDGLTAEQFGQMREWMREHEKYEDAPTLDPKAVAKRSGNESYIFYQHLTWDGHPSIETLNRYYVSPDENGVPGIDIQPQTKPGEIIETLNLLCLPVIGVFFGVNELITGSTIVPAALGEVAAEYKQLTEVTGGLMNS